MSNLAIGITVYAVLQAFWVLGALAAWRGHTFSVSQMLALGVTKGIPYVGHIGMWNDLFTIHPLLAIYAGIYWNQQWQWLTQWWFTPLVAASLAISWYANRMWVQDRNIITTFAGIAEDKIHSTGTMSSVAWIHVPHMAIIITIFVMMGLSITMGQVAWKFALGAAVLLLAHILMMQHPWLRELNPSWNPFPSMAHQKLMSIAFMPLVVLGLLLIASDLHEHVG